MIQLKSDIATEADTDWGFILNDELMADLKVMVEREAYVWNLSVEDTLQEVYLWLSVRPERTIMEETWKIVNAARQRVAQLRQDAKTQRANEIPLEDES